MSSPEYIFFKDKFTLEQRQQESNRIIQKYPNRIPVIVERAAGCKNIDNIDKNKFLVPEDLTVGQFQYVIRKRLSLDAGQALFLFIDDQLYPVTILLKKVYVENKSDDKFLYITYTGENTFG